MYVCHKHLNSYVGLSLICSKFYLLFLPKLLKKFEPLFLFYSHIITYVYYSCNFYCIGDNNVHNTHSDYYTGEQDIASADFSSEST